MMEKNRARIDRWPDVVVGTVLIACATQRYTVAEPPPQTFSLTHLEISTKPLRFVIPSRGWVSPEATKGNKWAEITAAHAGRKRNAFARFFSVFFDNGKHMQTESEAFSDVS